MNVLLKTIPGELQQHILDEIPQFTRLSKNDIAGKNHLDQISKKEITKEEFFRYIEEYKPSYFSIITENSFVIATRVNDQYAFDRFEIEIFPIYSVSRSSFYSPRSLDIFYNELKEKIFYDFITINNIYRVFRKECKTIKSILTTSIVNLYNSYQFDIGNHPHISIINTNIVGWLTVAAHYEVITNSYPKLIQSISSIMDGLRFDENGNYCGSQSIIDNFTKNITGSFARMMRKLIEYVK